MADWKAEAKEFGKINFDYLLMTHIQNINQQLAKLPHEALIANMNEPVGTTYKDIITSYCNMVQHLGELLKPYHDKEYTDLKLKEDISFSSAKNMFGCLMELCDRKGFLFVKTLAKASGEADG